MFTPSESTASERLADFYGEYTLARLTADPETAILSKGLEATQKAMRQANGVEREAYRHAQALTAARDHADFLLDEVVRAFELALLSTVSKNRQAPAYKACFPDGLTAVVAAPISQELNAVRRIEAHLAQGTSDLKPFVSKIAAAREALDKAHATLEEATNGHGVALAREMTARGEWVRSYRATYGTLTARFPENRRRVESYFRPGPRDERETPAPATQPQ